MHVQWYSSIFFLLAKSPSFWSIGQNRNYGGVEEVNTEPGIPDYQYILDDLITSPGRSFPRAQLEDQLVLHVHFQTQTNDAGAFECVPSVESEWVIRDPSAPHEHRLLQIHLKTDASTCFVEFG
ncbi:hypothetical protein RB195_018734 [Necator americanus]|uniref:Uncharacterized protein n=1 Tax=Necator americanus TaxID=51031 RepID=A0ABR1CB16_NECAM